MLVRGVEGDVRDEGAGPLLVWGHGLLSPTDQEDAGAVFGWRGLDSVRVVRCEARGHGGSEATDGERDYRWRSLAADMLGVLDAVAGPDAAAVLGGASMGCATAVHAALRAPDRVQGLVLVIPPTAWGGCRPACTASAPSWCPGPAWAARPHGPAGGVRRRRPTRLGHRGAGVAPGPDGRRPPP